MPNPPRDLPHFFIEGGGEKRPYTARGGGGETKSLPTRDRAQHAAKLSRELNSALSAARAGQSERPSDVTTPVTDEVSPQGLYLEFGLTGELVPEALTSLEDRRKGIELVTVRSSDDPDSGETIATVFVPARSADHFEKRIEEFREQDTRTGKPKNQLLVASINTVRPASPRSVFTDPADSYPTNDQQEVWWELWIRQGYEAQVDTAAQRLGIVVKPHVVRFPERDVKVVRANAQKLGQLMHQTDGLAELRLSRDTPSFFLGESNVDLRELVAGLLSRLVPLSDNEETGVAVCLLDSGIAWAHPLLNPRVDQTDVLTVDPTWGVADDAPPSHGGGHGTGMAGLALFGDLSEVLASSSAVAVPYRLESVKILPPIGANEPEAYGAITREAIGRAEASKPQRYRVVCLAITAEESGQAGRPSSWSAAVDQAASAAFDTPRLIVSAAGNIRDPTANWASDYLERNDIAEVESPGQAWNALTVGATTQKLIIDDPTYASWTALAPAGDLCPSSRTSLTFASQWPVKPDVVLEGGNYAHDGGPVIDACDDLQLLTTSRQIAARLFTTFGDSSAAAALGANLAARIAASHPSMWPETVRALIVHTAEWTPAMLARSRAEAGVARKRVLLRRYGYGVPDLARALHSAKNDLTLVIEDVLYPFRLDGSKVKTRQMSIHALPWPRDVLETLGEISVELRVTLSYFIEPNPGERGWTRRHRYASHGLRFEVKQPLETDDAFRSRLSQAIDAEEEERTSSVSGSEGWSLGPRARNSGSVHSDLWTGTATDLARRGAIGIYPVGGWWREQKRLERYNNAARYSLIVSIRAPDQDVDIYTPVRVALGIGVPSSIDIEIET